MKLIAHRGGLCGPENSLAALRASARLGADAVECDVRLTRDRQPVIFHDPGLTRLAGMPLQVADTDLAEMRRCLASAGRSVMTFDDLAAGYRETAPLLLHIKLNEPDAGLVKRITESGLPLIAGVQSEPALCAFAAVLPPERILAFIPSPKDGAIYAGRGAGILRFWEQWLGRMPPAETKGRTGAEVWVMSCTETQEPYEGIKIETMNGNPESLERCAALGADGVLLNDLCMALRWRAAFAAEQADERRNNT